MTKKNEIVAYGGARISLETGEIEDYDSIIFPNIIRNREIDIIRAEMRASEPKLVLDYGCGGGWLSTLLSGWGLDVVGIDISSKLIRAATVACPRAHFIVCDGERLPFRDGTFDQIMGISILHHVNLGRSLREIKRVSARGSKFLFMEPNLLNPLSALGRRLFPMETHTKGERPFTPSSLLAVLRHYDFRVEGYFPLFFSFPIARLFKITGKRPGNLLSNLISLLERFMERVPLAKNLNSTIVVLAK